MEKSNGNQFNITVFRYDPTKDKAGHYQTYQVPRKEGMTVLGALTYIYENIDSSLAFTYSCKWGQCCGCMARVGGQVMKTCLADLTADAKIEPLPGYEIIKDLVTGNKLKD